MAIKKLLAACALALVATSANAATVASVGTFGGGTDFVSSAGGALVENAHPAYVANSATSEWVWDEVLDTQIVTFSFEFDLTGFDVSTASLSGIWGADNVGTALLNGTAIAFLPDDRSSFQALQSYGTDTGFVEGTNVLSFAIVNDLTRFGYDPRINPASFRAEATITALAIAPVPLPAGAVLLLTGMGAVVAVRRRRKAA